MCEVLTACISQTPHVQTSRNFLYMSVAVARFSSDGNAICYILRVLWMTSCLSRNGANRPESKMMCVSFHSPDGGTGAKCAVCDCILSLL